LSKQEKLPINDGNPSFEFDKDSGQLDEYDPELLAARKKQDIDDIERL